MALAIKRRLRSRHNILLAWCLWLIGSWSVTLWTESVKIASSVMMPYAALMALMLLWPMLRLSQWRVDADGVAAPTSAGAVLREWLELNLVFQVVVWPLMLNARWSVTQTGWLDGAVAGWSLLTALIIAWGVRRGKATGRTVAMVLCLAILIAEPVLLGLINSVTESGHGITWTMRISPIGLVWDLTRPFNAQSTAQHGPQVIAVAVTAVLGWALLLTSAKGKEGPRAEGEEGPRGEGQGPRGKEGRGARVEEVSVEG